MTQYPSRSCPNCRTPLAEGQRFCSNCGTVIDAGALRPTERSASQYETRSDTPPPPPTTAFGGPSPATQYVPPTYRASGPPPAQPAQPAQMYQQGYPPPTYATPQKDSSGRVLRQFGCGMVLIILLIVGICGGSIYGAIWYFGNAAKSASTDTTTGSQNTDTNGNPAPVTPTVTTFKANTTTFTYAGVKMTILDAKRTKLTRLDLEEENTARANPRYVYTDAMLLVRADGTSFSATNSQELTSPEPGVKRQVWVDFDVPANVQVNQLTLRVGTVAQAQIDIPLTGSANLSKYAVKAITPNKQTQYSGTTWTLLQSTRQLNYDVEQAEKDKMFIVVKLKVDNPTAGPFYGDYGGWNFIRLKSGDTTAPPVQGCTLPVPVNAGSNGTGECAFAMPQSSTNFTLLLNDTQSGQMVTSFDFQIA